MRQFALVKDHICVCKRLAKLITQIAILILRSYPKKGVYIMDKTNSLSKEEMMTAFNMFLDDMLEQKIDFDKYLPCLREQTGASKNSPYEFMFRGFIGGIYVASLSEKTIVE